MEKNRYYSIKMEEIGAGRKLLQVNKILMVRNHLYGRILNGSKLVCFLLNLSPHG
jgi:hypothetical protein